MGVNAVFSGETIKSSPKMGILGMPDYRHESARIVARANAFSTFDETSVMELESNWCKRR